jgi:hypothetical protein
VTAEDKVERQHRKANEGNEGKEDIRGYGKGIRETNEGVGEEMEGVDS